MKALYSLAISLCLVCSFTIFANSNPEISDAEAVAMIRGALAVLPAVKAKGDFKTLNNGEEWIRLFDFTQSAKDVGELLKSKISPIVNDTVLRYGLIELAEGLINIQRDLLAKGEIDTDGPDNYGDLTTRYYEARKRYSEMLVKLSNFVTTYSVNNEIATPLSTENSDLIRRIDERQGVFMNYALVYGVSLTLHALADAHLNENFDKRNALGAFRQQVAVAIALENKLKTLKKETFDRTIRWAMNNFLDQLETLTAAAGEIVAMDDTDDTDQEYFETRLKAFSERFKKLAEGFEPFLETLKESLRDSLLTPEEVAKRFEDNPEIFSEELRRLISEIIKRQAELQDCRTKSDQVFADLAAARAELQRTQSQIASESERISKANESLTEREKALAQYQAQLAAAGHLLLQTVPTVEKSAASVVDANTYGRSNVTIGPLPKMDTNVESHARYQAFKSGLQTQILNELIRLRINHLDKISKGLKNIGIGNGDFNIEVAIQFLELEPLRFFGLYGFMGEMIVTVTATTPGFGRVSTHVLDSVKFGVSEKGKITFPQMTNFFTKDVMRSLRDPRNWDRLDVAELKNQNLEVVIRDACSRLLMEAKAMIAKNQPAAD